MAWGSSSLCLKWLAGYQETPEEQKLWSGFNCRKSSTDAVLGPEGPKILESLITYWGSVLPILCDEAMAASVVVDLCTQCMLLNE